MSSTPLSNRPDRADGCVDQANQALRVVVVLNTTAGGGSSTPLSNKPERLDGCVDQANQALRVVVVLNTTQ